MSAPPKVLSFRDTSTETIEESGVRTEVESSLTPSSRTGTRAQIRCTLSSLIGAATAVGNIALIEGEEQYVQRASSLPLSMATYREAIQFARSIGVTPNFRRVIDYFGVPEGELPAGFRVELRLEADRALRLDLVRDIAYGKNGVKRPTNVLFSADSANPYEVEPIKGLIANLTCNPGIIYDLFINNTKANVDHLFSTRDEVMQELGRILGPGCDMSVELNNPFARSEQEILDEVYHFRELLSEYRLVIKVPHTGPVNADNMEQLLTGDKKFKKRYDQVETKDAFRGHNLALLLSDHGIRVNFTLMFEPYQAILALQAKPYFINCFIRHRAFQAGAMKRALTQYAVTDDPKYLEELRAMMVEKDYLSPGEKDLELLKVKRTAEDILRYRKFDSPEGSDGLDAVRHNLRLLRTVNLPDTRLIICSMEGPNNFPDIDSLLCDDQYADVMDRVVVTAEPNYLAQFTTCNQVISYQRRFLNAAKGQK
ncbi:MAG: transaldolase [Acidobacteria bacterium]|nr:MAG: transaldolase [Acidobacteriota bacterium]